MGLAPCSPERQATQPRVFFPPEDFWPQINKFKTKNTEKMTLGEIRHKLRGCFLLFLFSGGRPNDLSFNVSLMKPLLQPAMVDARNIASRGTRQLANLW